MRSETSDDVVDIQEAQLCEPTTEDVFGKSMVVQLDSIQEVIGFVLVTPSSQLWSQPNKVPFDWVKGLDKRDIDLYKSQYKFLHIGMVQIAFKPLTLKGLPETFLAALRDTRNLNFRQSLMGSIESTVAYSPVYFNTQPNLQLSLTDFNILDALTLNVKTHGYNYALGSELICLSYRIYFKLLANLNPRCKLYDTSDQTILVKTNFAKSKVTTRRPIKRGRSSSKSSGSSYGSLSNCPIIQRGGMSLVKLTSPSKEAASSIHLDDARK
ncbi:hypothetical protein H5410_065107 [Solanum commersonii]|uniref:Uncharacterized protein n=1 Tax=Solanum commersonii TaxID=4109 RepID=A0A9J5VXD1_SOLCO|nr:hypothetical protein H5410_065107 [Solanum commersonii]